MSDLTFPAQARMLRDSLAKHADLTKEYRHAHSLKNSRLGSSQSDSFDGWGLEGAPDLIGDQLIAMTKEIQSLGKILLGNICTAGAVDQPGFLSATDQLIIAIHRDGPNIGLGGQNLGPNNSIPTQSMSPRNQFSLDAKFPRDAKTIVCSRLANVLSLHLNLITHQEVDRMLTLAFTETNPDFRAYFMQAEPRVRLDPSTLSNGHEKRSRDILVNNKFAPEGTPGAILVDQAKKILRAAQLKF